MTPVAVISKQYQTPAGIQIKTRLSRITVITESRISPAAEVREKFKRVKPLKEIVAGRRCCAAPILGQSGSSAPPSWTLDVLNIVRRLVSEGRAPRAPNSGKMGRHRTPPSDSFTTADAYAFTRELEQLHPDNRHVKDKIRQQLQVLRDLGLLLHVGLGVWRLP